MARNVIQAWEDINRVLNNSAHEPEVKHVFRPRPFSISSKPVAREGSRPLTGQLQSFKREAPARLNKVVPFATKPELGTAPNLFLIRKPRLSTANEKSEQKAIKNIKYLNQKFRSLPISFFVEIYNVKTRAMSVQ